MTIWLNGRLIEGGAASIAHDDRGLTLGDGIFETLKISAWAPRFFDRHWARLEQGAALLGIPLTRSAGEMRGAIEQLSRAAGLADAAIRMTLTRGPAPRGVLPPATPAPTWLVTIGPLPEFRRIDLVIATVTRRNEHSPLCRVKTTNYLDNILALREASGRGANDALLLNTGGNIAEASAANCFVQLDGRLVTPPVADGALPGIARGLILEHCGAIEASISPDDLRWVTGGFLSTSLGFRPIGTLDGRPCDSDDLTRHCAITVQTLPG